ncbi:HlyD family secretion protein [Clostridium saccharobutylicum]|uniref:Colicin V secretion protein CvaA n=1 Tax=Clostridium saccharobutylicum TaxID=169679 RepID=A0A1S8N4H8_CLOSA|nr:efflux RND transporter periplasmic adaptor subunit [Clostridium saccharobutylicum]OOM11315.1 colicin V secretion protein CvaA [Clostridium saccharobutylicum]
MLKLNIKKLKPKGISLSSLKPKGKLKKKVIFLIVIFVVVIALIIGKIIMPKPVPSAKCTTLSKGEIVNKVSVLGKIKSQESTNIYSTVDNVIKEVKVKEGDEVKAGDVLAILDSSGLEKDIEQQTAAADADDASSRADIDSTKKAYDDALRLHDESVNSEIKNAEEALRVAKINLDDKNKIYEKNKTLFSAGAITESDLDKTKIDFETASSDYEKAKVSLEDAKAKSDQALNTAKSSYETAQAKGNDKSKRIGIEKLKQQLDNCVIKATTDGTITNVNAVVGNPGSGILFQIENLDNVEITVPIKEVDIANVKVGQKAEIKTEATGEEIIAGEVMSISPVAGKEAMLQSQGKSASGMQPQSQDTSSDSGFEAKVKVDDKNENMKVGMSARVNIITSEKSDIYAVSSENIVGDGDNKSIYVAEKDGQKPNEYIIKELPINTGLESDFNIEISGEGISDGIFVIDDPSTCKVGEKIQIKGE